VGVWEDEVGGEDEADVMGLSDGVRGGEGGGGGREGR